MNRCWGPNFETAERYFKRRAQVLKRIYINRATCAKNKETGAFEPAICVKTSKGVVQGHEVTVEGYLRFIQHDGVVKSAGGATVYAETKSPVRVRLINPVGVGNDTITDIE